MDEVFVLNALVLSKRLPGFFPQAMTTASTYQLLQSSTLFSRRASIHPMAPAHSSFPHYGKQT